MKLIPEFLASYQFNQGAVGPTEIEGDGPLEVKSFWGFDSIPTSAKPWLIGNTVQVFEPTGIGTTRVWELNTTFGVPYDVPRMEKAGRIVPTLAGDDLEAEMRQIGYGAGEWNVSQPILTYTFQGDAEAIRAILEQIRSMAATPAEVAA